MKIQVETTLYAGTTATVNLPEGKTWDDVKTHFVKWDTLHVLFHGDDDYKELPLDSETMDIIDWKRPTSVVIYPCDEDGEPDYSIELVNW